MIFLLSCNGKAYPTAEAAILAAKRSYSRTHLDVAILVTDRVAGLGDDYVSATRHRQYLNSWRSKGKHVATVTDDAFGRVWVDVAGFEQGSLI